MSISNALKGGEEKHWKQQKGNPRSKRRETLEGGKENKLEAKEEEPWKQEKRNSQKAG